jgi:hypothetical protein
MQNSQETQNLSIYYLQSYTYIKLKKPRRDNLQLKPLIGGREIVNLSYVSQCTNAPRLAQTKAPR